MVEIVFVSYICIEQHYAAFHRLNKTWGNSSSEPSIYVDLV